MRFFGLKLMIGACLAIGCFAVSCKNVRETKSPRNSGLQSRSSSQVVADDLSAFSKRDVSFDDVPRVSVTIDLRQCIGAGRWFDPAKPASPRIGAVSVTLTKETSLAPNESQPDPWLFEPDKDSQDPTSEPASETHAWRIPAAKFRVDAVAFGVATNSLESKITKTIDLASNKDLKVTIIGTWSARQTCELASP
jgi:hypothetical protein